MLSNVSEQEYMTVAEVAARLRVDQETVRRWLRVNKLHGVNLGGAGGWRVTNADLDAFLEDRRGQTE
jgi:excisionase family DNA binding protein